MKNVKGIVLLFGTLIMLTGCQEKKASTTENSSFSVTTSKVKTESKSSDKTSSSGNDSNTSSSKPEIEEISAEEYEKKSWVTKVVPVSLSF